MGLNLRPLVDNKSYRASKFHRLRQLSLTELDEAAAKAPYSYQRSATSDRHPALALLPLRYP